MLEGLKVVEFATHIAAPGAAGILADWGADVIKVETGRGDPMRYVLADLVPDGVAPAFHLDNRGKRSIRLDVRSEAGREALRRMIRQADVFLTSRRPAALKSAQLDWDSVHEENPRLVYASVTGYGTNGPDADLPGYDVAAFWARAGVAGLLIPKGEEPFVLRTGMGDHVCSLATVSGILAALVQRHATGKGRLVETSLLRSGVYTAGSDLAAYLRLGKIKGNRRRKETPVPLVNFFRTRDGQWVCVMPRSHRQDWPKICRAAGRGDLIDHPDFQSDRARRENAHALVTALDEGFGALDYAEVAQRLRDLDIVYAPVQSASQLAADPQAEAAGCFIDLRDRDGAPFRNPATPVNFPAEPLGTAEPAPDLGMHTEQVLAELGFSSAEIEAMTAQAEADTDRQGPGAQDG